MRSRRYAWIPLLATLVVAREASAAPRNTVWLEDVRIEKPGIPGTTLVYEHQAADLKAMGQGFDLLTLRMGLGMSQAIEVAPLVRVRQRGSEPMELNEIGGEVRGRVLGQADRARVVAYGGYLADLSGVRANRLWAGGTARHELGRVYFGGDLRLGGGAGGERGRALEGWVGGAAGYGFFAERNLTLGLETFLVSPFVGERISDPTFGASGTSMTYYFGPSLSARIGPLWTAASAVTGLRVMSPSSDLLIRWTVGVSY